MGSPFKNTGGERYQLALWYSLKGAVLTHDTTTLSWVWNLILPLMIASKVMQICLVIPKIILRHFLGDKPAEFDGKTMFYWYAHRSFLAIFGNVHDFRAKFGIFFSTPSKKIKNRSWFFLNVVSIRIFLIFRLVWFLAWSDNSGFSNFDWKKKAFFLQ